MVSFLRTYAGTFNERQIVTADTDDIVPSAGFYVDATGTLSCRLRNEAALADMPVVVGEFYPFDIVQVDITGSTTVTTVVLVRTAPA